ncbi:peptidase [Actinomyces bowdenii]|uniref:DUF5979 domain-containing protein n=1 Tax=Actinomyces bowdenii TaxID=131109 RepID=UPI001ABC124D|nr:DUF5979 domain-containing protein [Actinomyces bowdenii]MBO3725121.1 peptidase [Actinomyces bowdenii]
MLVFADRGSPMPGLRLAVALLALPALLLGLLAPLQAHAAINQGIVVKDLALIKSDRDGNNGTGALTTQDVAKLSYSWDATGTTVNPGDSFSIDLGAHFKNLESPKTVAMSLPYNGVQTEIGSCALTERTMECTFSEKVTELKNAGFTGFKGSGEALLLITQTTTAEEVDMTVNGNQTVKVDLPGTGGIKDAPKTVYTPLKFSKISAVITSTSSSVVWEVNFGSDYIKEQLAGGANPIVADGTTRQTITITDTLGPGMAYNPDLSKWGLMLRNSAAEPDLTGVAVTTAAGKDLNTTYGDFDMAVDIQGQVSTITITGPFAAQSNYKVYYPVTFTSQNGKATAGVQYKNSASLNDSGAQAEFTRSYTDSFKVNVQMEAGFGGFEVVKGLAGTGVDAVDVANTTLPVAVDYTLPGPASGYAGWQAPGTLNPDGISGTATLDVRIGRTNTFQGTFPQGTTITLTEDTGRAAPAPEGYTWGEPVFAVGKTETNRLTIADRVSTKVTLTNTAELVQVSGTFQVTKTATGVEPPPIEGVPGVESHDFPFSYTCSDGQSGTITAKGDGVAVQADKTFPVGTTCTLSEDTGAAAIDGYTLNPPADQTVTIKDPAEPVVTAAFVNAYTRNEGTFTIAKTVQGGPADAATGTFSFDYICDTGEQGTLEVPAGSATTSPWIAAGATCTLSENADSAAREGYAVASVLSQDRVTIATKRDVTVTATNTYTRDTGAFSIAKAVEGGAPDFAKGSFTFAYSCTGGIEGELTVPGDGTVVTSPRIPAGASCTLTEDAASAAREGYAVASTLSQDSVTIAKDQTAAVTATNTYTRETGTFAVKKAVEGDYTPTGDDKVAVGYTCDDPEATTGSLEVAMGGPAVSGPSLPTGTSCTLTEDPASAHRDGFAVATAYSAPTVTIVKDQAPEVVVTNTYTRLTGGFSVSKTVAGDGAALAADKEFTFTYTCTDAATGKAGQPQELTLKAGQTKQVSDVPTGSCTLSEAQAGVENTSWTGSLAVNGKPVTGNEAAFDITGAADAAVAVSATNTYTLDRGTFSVAKELAGDGAEEHKAKTFTFDYSCTSLEGERKGEIQVPGDGSAAESGLQLPIGATCEVTERPASAQVEGYDVATPEAQSLTIEEKGTTKKLSFTNTYTRHMGSFSVAKQVTGAQVGDKEFTFTYTCTNGETGTLPVKADGQAVEGPKVPVGTECTISEDGASAGLEGYTLTAPADQAVTISKKDAVEATTFTNVYAEVPPPADPTPTPTPTPGAPSSPGEPAPSTSPAASGPSLARTGISVGLPIAVALAAIIGGAFLIRRRKA